MTDEIDELFKSFDVKTGSYKVRDNIFKLRELSVDEMELLQDKEAEMNDLDASKLTAKETLEYEREWQKFVLAMAFGEDYESLNVKQLCTAGEYKKMVAEVFVFLAKFSGPRNLQDYIITLKGKKESIKKMQG